MRTKDDFVARATKKHNGKYDYSVVDFKEYTSNPKDGKDSGRFKVAIKCPIHGEFKQSISDHLNGRGCGVCRYISSSSKTTKTNEQYIIDATKKHSGKFDYSLTDYKNAKCRIKIICPIHGVFEANAHKHLCGDGCGKCFGKDKTVEELIIAFKKIHGDKYIYKDIKTTKSKGYINVICPKHGSFKVMVGNHLNKEKFGCPGCKNSKSEEKIFNFLKDNGIEFEIQKKFDECKDKRVLRFDFYIPKFNLLLEYDGELHYHHWVGGNRSKDKGEQIRRLNGVKRRDKIKDEFAKKNGIDLLRIPYWEKKNIEVILSEKLENCRNGIGAVSKIVQPQRCESSSLSFSE